MKTITLTALATLALCAPAFATNLTNKDSTSYDIAVKGSSSTMKTSIGSNTTKTGVCSSSTSSCKIAVEGVGEIEVSGSDNVIIRNGTLEKD